MTDEQFYSWLAGFADGEAHFGVTLATSASGRISGSPRFCLTLRDDDEGVLAMAAGRLGVGKLRRLSRQRQRDAGEGCHDAVAWEVTGPSCATVAQALQGRMHSKKAAECDLWSPVVLKCAAMPRVDTRRAPLLIQLRSDLAELRKYTALNTPKREKAPA